MASHPVAHCMRPCMLGMIAVCCAFQQSLEMMLSIALDLKLLVMKCYRIVCIYSGMSASLLPCFVITKPSELLAISVTFRIGAQCGRSTHFHLSSLRRVDAAGQFWSLCTPLLYKRPLENVGIALTPTNISSHQPTSKAYTGWLVGTTCIQSSLKSNFESLHSQKEPPNRNEGT